VGSPYQVDGRWYVPRHEPGYDAIGLASWYGDDFHGRYTSNGEIYDMNALTAAHPTLPMPSYAYITNLENNRTILVRINDRGPYVSDRVIDLSRASARSLGIEQRGLSQVRVRYAGPAPLDGNDTRERRYLASQPWTGGTTRFVSATYRYGAPAETSSIYANSGWSAVSYRTDLARR
jgi:rare lipoprotein A